MAQDPEAGLDLDHYRAMGVCCGLQESGCGSEYARKWLRAFSLDNVTAGQQARRDGAVLWRAVAAHRGRRTTAGDCPG